jgi:hypothetical protein
MRFLVAVRKDEVDAEFGHARLNGGMGVGRLDYWRLASNAKSSGRLLKCEEYLAMGILSWLIGMPDKLLRYSLGSEIDVLVKAAVG